MNERMIKLYQQALKFAYENVNKEIWNTDNFHALVAGKFAELIVRECADCVDFYTSDGNGPASDVILNHFGVK